MDKPKSEMPASEYIARRVELLQSRNKEVAELERAIRKITWDYQRELQKLELERLEREGE